jgi:hypothetical protein
MPDVLRACPIRRNWAVAEHVYSFINSNVHKASDELKKEYVRIYVWVFARPSNQLVEYHISRLLMLTSLVILIRVLSDYDNPQTAVASLLEGDEYKIACFWEFWNGHYEMASGLIAPQSFEVVDIIGDFVKGDTG